jgi:hypothetical protein
MRIPGLLGELRTSNAMLVAAETQDIARLRGVRARRLREFGERGSDFGPMRLRPV